MSTSAAPRWVVYQRERFPILAHGALIAAFSSGAVCYSAQLRAARDGTKFSVLGSSLLVAFVSCLLFFFELRVSDEHKDFEDDLRWRPYRPVPRGLVTLRELTRVAVAGALVQLALALWLEPRLVAPLLVVWGFMALMTREFFVREWLRRHPIVVLWSHMLILPLIDLYATACDWMPSGSGRVLAQGLVWFLVASFFNGIVVEIGRKIRAPADEETGVETYSALWGVRRATVVWLGAMACTLLFATLAAREVGAGVDRRRAARRDRHRRMHHGASASLGLRSRAQASARSCSRVCGRSRCISASECFPSS